MRTQGTGSGADTALDAHLDPLAFLNIVADLPQEIVAVVLNHFDIQVFTHGGT